MKLGKAPGKDNITTDLLAIAGETIHKAIAQLFTRCVREKKVPQKFRLGIVTLHKKQTNKTLETIDQLPYYLTI